MYVLTHLWGAYAIPQALLPPVLVLSYARRLP